MTGSRRTFKRASWGVADQVLSTVTNFVLAILVARNVGPNEFGAFSLAFSTYLVAINVARPIGVEPLIIRFSDQRGEPFRRASIGSISTAALVGALAGMAAAIIGAVVGGPQGNAFFALAVTLPGLVIQDSWRLTFFAGGRGAAAVANDLIWTLTMIPLILLELAGPTPSVAALILAWGGSGSIAALAGFVQSRVAPSVASIRGWLGAHSDITRYMLIDRLVAIGADQAPSYVIASVLGLPAVASIRAAQLLLGPYSVFRQGIQLVVAPEGVRLLAVAPQRLEWACRRYSAILSLGLACAAAVAFLLPESIGTALLGSNWALGRSVLLPVVVGSFGAAVSAGGGLGIYVLGAVDRGLRLGIVVAAVTLVGVAIGASLGSAWTAASGIAVATWIGAAAVWQQFWVAKREYLAGTAKVSRDRPRLAFGEPFNDVDG